MDTRQRILDLARLTVQAHGYGRLSFRELAKEIGIKSASIHYHFPAKAELGAAVMGDYCAAARADLELLAAASADPAERLRAYVAIFRKALENGNRLCLAGFLAAERHDLPEKVQREVEAFIALNVAWLAQTLGSEQRAGAVYAAIAGAQLTAHGAGDVAAYDRIIEAYRVAGLIPA
ncbi:MAG: TetR/AcrR family transcriptional regulator [Candidatus Andeanibacterium colombiense]|uniref:TetR/AcrR family transcriptional regulator n=1 Tax=Candidatus Andeanibacterium colombiense TaxID=3121345 RepID=A0AAJ5XB70_9SPHN|nr:MAG: TetR/AcrR family transcriptional regulator [Sphingomonadaceae bacterium]